MLPPLGGLASLPAPPPAAAPLVLLLPPTELLPLFVEPELEPGMPLPVVPPADVPPLDMPLEVAPELPLLRPRFCLPVPVELPFGVLVELLYCWSPLLESALPELAPLEPEFMLLPGAAMLPEVPAPLVLPVAPDGVVCAMAAVPANIAANSTAAVCVFMCISCARYVPQHCGNT